MVAALVVGAVCATRTWAATDTWTGATDSSFADSNWTGDNPPQPGDALVFTSGTGLGGTALSDNLMTPGAFSVAGITFNAGAAPFVVKPAVSGSNGFALTGPVSNNGTQLETIDDLIRLSGAQTFATHAGGGNITCGGNLSGSGLVNSGSGTLTLAGTNSLAGVITDAAGTLTLSGSTSTGGSNITVGTGAGAAAILNIAANVTLFDLDVGGGATGAGAVYQTSGTMTLTDTTTGAGPSAPDRVLSLGGSGSQGSAGYGYYGISGGALLGEQLDIGARTSGGIGVMDVTGGLVASTAGKIGIARGNSTGGYGLLNVTGGTVDFDLGGTTLGSGGALEMGNVTGNIAVVNVGNLLGGTNAALIAGPSTGSAATNEVVEMAVATSVSGTSVINLLPYGTLAPAQIRATNANSATALINFNGGTLRAASANIGPSFLASPNIAAVTVYGNGGTIDNGGTAITVGNSLVAASGTGVASIAVTGGSNYIGAPFVAISGGGGAGATAYAMVSSGTISRIVVTSPGTGYISTPTVTLLGGGASIPASSAVATLNGGDASGGMTLQGSGTTTLTGTSNYSGPTDAAAGTIILTGDLSATAAVAVSGSATLEDDQAITPAAAVTCGGTVQGIGSIGPVSVGAGGTLGPGITAAASVSGTLTANGNVVLAGGASTFAIPLGTASAGDSGQLLMSSGTVSLAGATLQLNTGAAYAPQTMGYNYVLINGGAGQTGSNGNVFAQGSSITASNGDVFNILYASDASGTGSGNDVVAQLAGNVATLPPGPPTGFQAAVEWNNGNPFAALQWSPGTTGMATSFLLEREVNGSGNYQRVSGLNASILSFNDYWITAGTSYTYRISAIGTTGTSGYAYATISAAPIVPLGYLAWAQALWPATGDSLAAGSLWTDVGTDGLPNSLRYAFSGNPVLRGGPGQLAVVSATSRTLEVWGNSFTAAPDVHYNLQGSPDLANWQTYLTETSPAFANISGGPGATAPLLGVNPSVPASPLYFRWSITPNTAASATPTGGLVDGLSGSSGATVTLQDPVFSWEVGNGTQSDYEILVATSPALLASGSANVWDSGEVSGTSSLSIAYSGTTPLQNNTTYYWTVRTWDSSGDVSTYTTPQSFTTGTLSSTYATNPPRLVEEQISPVQFIGLGGSSYFVDFGTDSWGTVTLNISSPVPGGVVTVEMGEELTGSDTVDSSPPSGSYIRYQSQTITMESGVTTYTVTPTWSDLYSGYVTPPSYIGQVAPFRYVEVKNVPAPFSAADVTQLSVHVPFNSAAATFTSSDPLLNAIWTLCKHTTIATTFDSIYVDGDRERIPYEADGYIHMLNQFSVDRDYSTPRYSAEYLYGHPTWPTEWPMHCILMAWADYLYTGDSRSLQANYTTLKGKLFLSSTTNGHPFGRRTLDGLFQNDTSTGSGSYPSNIVDIVDWPGTSVKDVNGTTWPEGERDNYDMTRSVKTVLAAFHYQTLSLMQQIATALGNTSDASTYQSMAATTATSVNTILWSGSNYIDGVTPASTSLSSVLTGTSTHAALHANMFPLAFNMVPQSQMASVLSYIESRGIVCSPYGAQYLFEALYQAGAGTYAQSLFDSTGLRSWYNMMNYADSTRKPTVTDSTMTMEAWDLSLKTDLDWNHAWGSAAANIIPHWLMGIRPLLPGFQKLLIQPQPGTLSYASITVPTILGPVSENVETNTAADFAMSVNIPANTTALVGVPSLSSTSTTVYVDGVPATGTVAGGTLNPQWAVSEKPAGVSSTGLVLSGSTVWIDNVTPGPHFFERLP